MLTIKKEKIFLSAALILPAIACIILYFLNDYSELTYISQLIESGEVLVYNPGTTSLQAGFSSLFWCSVALASYVAVMIKFSDYIFEASTK